MLRTIVLWLASTLLRTNLPKSLDTWLETHLLFSKKKVCNRCSWDSLMGARVPSTCAEEHQMSPKLIGVNYIGRGANSALGGMYLEEQTVTMKSGTLCWVGLVNLYWFANRNEGFAGLYAGRVLPSTDPASAKCHSPFSRSFLASVRRNLGASCLNLLLQAHVP